MLKMSVERNNVINKRFKDFLKSLDPDEFIGKQEWSSRDEFNINYLKDLDSYQSERNYLNVMSDYTEKDKKDFVEKLEEEIMDAMDIFYLMDSQSFYLANKFIDKNKDISSDYTDQGILSILNDENNDFLNENLNIDLNIKDLLENTNVKVQLEMDYDNINQCGYKMVEDKEAIHDFLYENGSKDKISNFMKFFIKSQGYDIEDLKDNEKIKNSVFLDSLIDEFDNMFENQGGVLSAIFNISLNDYLDLLANKYVKMVIPKDFMLGFFASGCGGGSSMSIELEKDFTLPVECCLFTPVGLYKNSYTIEDVYGIYAKDNLYNEDLKKYNDMYM